MIVETLGLSLLIGKLRGGKIKNLEKLQIKGWYMFIIGFIMEIISILIVATTDGKLAKFIIENFFTIHILIYIIVIVGLIFNIREKGMWLALIGTLLNFIPILINDGKMPVSIEGLNSSYLYTQLDLLESDRILTHILANEYTKCYYLSDIIPIPKPYPFPKIISIGDILIGIGIFLLIQNYMRYESKEINMINFSNNQGYNKIGFKDNNAKE